MHVKRRLLAILNGSIRGTKSIGDKTRKTIQSVFHHNQPNDKTSATEKDSKARRGKKRSLLQIGRCETSSSQLQLLSNEVENEEEDLRVAELSGKCDEISSANFNPSADESRRLRRSHRVHADVQTQTTTWILFEEPSTSASTSLTGAGAAARVLEAPSIPIPTFSEDTFESSLQSHTATVGISSSQVDEFDSSSKTKNVNFKHNDNNDKGQQSQVEGTVPAAVAVISTEQLPIVKIKSKSKWKKSKLRRRLSLKNLKKSGRGVRKLLTSGFKAMGNSMIYATHAIPVSYGGYECPASYVTRAGDADWNNEYEFEEDRRKYIEFWNRAVAAKHRAEDMALASKAVALDALSSLEDLDPSYSNYSSNRRAGVDVDDGCR